MSKYTITKEIEAFEWNPGPDQKEDPEWIISFLINKRAEIINDYSGFYMSFLDSSYDERGRAYPGDYIIYDGEELSSMPPKKFKEYTK